MPDTALRTHITPRTENITTHPPLQMSHKILTFISPGRSPDMPRTSLLREYGDSWEERTFKMYHLKYHIISGTKCVRFYIPHYRCLKVKVGVNLYICAFCVQKHAFSHTFAERVKNAHRACDAIKCECHATHAFSTHVYGTRKKTCIALVVPLIVNSNSYVHSGTGSWNNMRAFLHAFKECGKKSASHLLCH